MIDTGKKVEFRGVPIEFGNTVLIVPALECDQADELAAKISEATDAVPRETFQDHASWYAAVRVRSKTMRGVIRTALVRNYPEITDQEFSKFVTEENIGDCFDAATGRQAGQKIKDPGEYKPAESRAAGLT
jgi:hypothetical protein